jgi:hypothetical protein
MHRLVCKKCKSESYLPNWPCYCDGIVGIVDAKDCKSLQEMCDQMAEIECLDVRVDVLEVDGSLLDVIFKGRMHDIESGWRADKKIFGSHVKVSGTVYIFDELEIGQLFL